MMRDGNYGQLHQIEMPGTDVSEDESDWLSLSLVLAMRGMEDEDLPEYTVTDLKERFSLTGDAQGTPAQGCERPL